MSLSQISQWTVFYIGLVTIVAGLWGGFYVETFWTSYEKKRRIHQEIEGGTDKVFGVILFFCYRVLVAPISAFVYLISPECRHQVAVNLVDWKVNVLGDSEREYDVAQYIKRMLQTLTKITDASRTEWLVRDVFGANWYKVDEDVFAGELRAKISAEFAEREANLKTREEKLSTRVNDLRNAYETYDADIKAFKKIEANFANREALANVEQIAAEPTVPEPVEDLRVLVEDEPVAKEVTAPAETPAVKPEPSLADVIAMIEATNKRFNRLSRSKTTKPVTRRVKPKAKRKVVAKKKKPAKKKNR